jgi:2'-phosphotransferase
VQVEALELKPVEKAEDAPVMVHGTSYKLWPVICKLRNLLPLLSS